MQLNRDQFLEEGYLILRNVVPPDELEALRAAKEKMVERQKETWAQERGPDDPPGGMWETSAQPRLLVHNNPELVDEQTAKAVEFWLHENTLGVSSELLQMSHAAITEIMTMCNPVRDHGPASWHRDIHPFDTSPLEGYTLDIAENGPHYVQWNIPLYDDDVLWVVPGSHLRINSEDEDRRLLEDPRVPLPNGVQTQLNAGDGVVYITPILHWGSNYSTKKRRTLHGGYCPFTAYPDLSYTRYLSDAAQDTFGRWEKQSGQSKDRTEAALRAALAKDAAGFRQALEVLQPGLGDKGKLLLTVYLCKVACYVNILNNPDFEPPAPQLRSSAHSSHPTTLNWGPPFAARFSPQEAAELWRRFVEIDEALRADEEHFAPSFQSGPMHYYFNEMKVDLDAFINAWSAENN